MFNYPLFKAIDGNGDPIRGGLLYSYAEGTSTAKYTYSEKTCTTKNTNPVVLDSNGEATVYLLGAYKFNLKTSAGAQVPGWPVDNVMGISEVYLDYNYPDYAATDQGLTGYSNTVKYYVDTIGTTNKASIYLRHNSGSEWTDYTFSTNETIPSNITLIFEAGARLAIATGVTVTINGGVEAGLNQIFSCTGTGAVSFGSGAVKEVYPEWWATNTVPGTTDMTAAVQAGLVAAGSSFPVKLQATTYLMSDTLDVNVTGNSLLGSKNNQIYGTGNGYTILKFTKADVAVNSWFDSGDSYNTPYIQLENITIDGNSVATVGFDGGYFIRLKNVHIVNCVTAGLRIGKVGGSGSAQASKYENCSFNANLDGILFVEGGTQHFENCFIRQNTQYGISGAPGGNTTFQNCIIESNTSSGLNLSGDLGYLHFLDCYWEENDAALGANGYQIRANITGDSDSIIFDNNIFGSTVSVKILNIADGRFIFNNCSQTGSVLVPQMTLTSGTEVVAYRSFPYSPMPVGVKTIAGVYVDPLSSMVFTDENDYIDISALTISFGSANFAVSFVVEPNTEAESIRDVLGAAVDSFGLAMLGSASGMSSILCYKLFGAYFGGADVDLRANVPHHIIYNKVSDVGYIYHNAVLVASFADTNNYTADQTRIGNTLAAPTGMQSKLYAFTMFSAGLSYEEVFALWRNGGNALAAGIGSKSLDLQFTNRTATTIYDSVSAGELSVTGATHWTNPKY